MFIVIPAYNEEKNVGRVLGGLFKLGFRNIVVVDDGSIDQTLAESKKAGACVLRHEVNRGQGAALQTGDEYALAQGADMVVHFDADGQFNPADIIPAVEALAKSRADVVLGSRLIDNRSNVPWTKRWVILPVSRIINRLFTGIKLTDAHNGFRALNRKALETIRITHDRMAHNSDIIRQIKKNNLKFIEIPVQVLYYKYGQGVEGGIRILWDLLFAKLWRT